MSSHIKDDAKNSYEIGFPLCAIAIVCSFVRPTELFPLLFALLIRIESCNAGLFAEDKVLGYLYIIYAISRGLFSGS